MKQLPQYVMHQKPPYRGNWLQQEWLQKRLSDKDLFPVRTPSNRWEIWIADQNGVADNYFKIFGSFEHFDSRVEEHLKKMRWISAKQQTMEEMQAMQERDDKISEDSQKASGEAVDRAVSVATDPTKRAKSIISYAGQENKTKTRVRIS